MTPLLALVLPLAAGCGSPPAHPGQGREDAGTPHPDAGADGATDGHASIELLGAPLVFAPTPAGFGVSAVVSAGEPADLGLQIQTRPAGAWTDADIAANPAPDVAQWTVTGLPPGLRVPYRLVRRGSTDPLYAGSAQTARAPGQRFTFALIADTHIAPRDPVPAGTTAGGDAYGAMEQTMLQVMPAVRAAAPDFLLNLGDLLDYHRFGFNAPPPDSAWARLAYLNYRRLLGDATANAAHFTVIGNWDGESGCNSPDEIARSTSQRLLYAPGPSPATYPEGGSANQDYYAFTWGDALFVVLNVMTYTPTCHLLDYDPGVPDDWTLGAAQLAWLQRTLAAATSKWRFLFIHHAVGGAAGDLADTAYGRGGGQAAHVGEQAQIHALMLQYGVQIFFYAHDHVFTDMVVDGVHYTLPGSAGAPWKFDETQTGYAQYWTDSGFARVDVSPDRVQVGFISTSGETLDSFSVP
ncbi:MAG: metallophosphoesterase family protein [Polyangia bacterium]